MDELQALSMHKKEVPLSLCFKQSYVSVTSHLLKKTFESASLVDSYLKS